MVENSSPNPRLGRFVEASVAGEAVRAFVPPPLPPDPPIEVPALVERLLSAQHALGQLNGITPLLPRPELFLYMYVRKEAVLSSQIEGTQSTLTDLLRIEAEAQAGQQFDDIREVSNYVDAMMYGLERLESLPLSLRLIREMHERLLQSGRGGSKSPGEFRRSQNWIGPPGSTLATATYVPPPVDEMNKALGDWELFLHDRTSLPDLVQCALMHEQFEAIHPFLDGNGRVGRLLITLFLTERSRLTQPLLYLSAYIEAHRRD
ncbi:MAG: Fic family protein, partial [Rhodospirillales bacterium]